MKFRIQNKIYNMDIDSKKYFKQLVQQVNKNEDFDEDAIQKLLLPAFVMAQLLIQVDQHRLNLNLLLVLGVVWLSNQDDLGKKNKNNFVRAISV